jgi:hypothetical protein
MHSRSSASDPSHPFPSRWRGPQRIMPIAEAAPRIPSFPIPSYIVLFNCMPNVSDLGHFLNLNMLLIRSSITLTIPEPYTNRLQFQLWYLMRKKERLLNYQSLILHLGKSVKISNRFILKKRCPALHYKLILLSCWRYRIIMLSW